MKKLFTILSLMGAAIFTSCDNDNSVNPQPLGIATVKGTVFAQFDYTNSDYETVANRKMIIAIYDEYNESVRFTEATTDANGNYSFEVEVGNRGLEVGMQLVDFKADVKYDASTTEEETFYGEGFENGAYIIKGGEYIRDIYYND